MNYSAQSTQDQKGDVKEGLEFAPALSSYGPSETINSGDGDDDVATNVAKVTSCDDENNSKPAGVLSFGGDVIVPPALMAVTPLPANSELNCLTIRHKSESRGELSGNSDTVEDEASKPSAILKIGAHAFAASHRNEDGGDLGASKNRWETALDQFDEKSPTRTQISSRVHIPNVGTKDTFEDRLKAKLSASREGHNNITASTQLAQEMIATGESSSAAYNPNVGTKGTFDDRLKAKLSDSLEGHYNTSTSTHRAHKIIAAGESSSASYIPNVGKKGTFEDRLNAKLSDSREGDNNISASTQLAHEMIATGESSSAAYIPNVGTKGTFDDRLKAKLSDSQEESHYNTSALTQSLKKYVMGDFDPKPDGSSQIFEGNTSHTHKSEEASGSFGDEANVGKMGHSGQVHSPRVGAIRHKGEDVGTTKNKGQNNQKGVVVGTYPSKGSVSGDSECPGTTFATRFEERIQMKLANIGNADGRSPTSMSGNFGDDANVGKMGHSGQVHSPRVGAFRFKGEDAGPTKNKGQNNQKGVVVGTYPSKGSVSGDSECPGTTFATRFEEQIQMKLANIGNADGRSPTSTSGNFGDEANVGKMGHSGQVHSPRVGAFRCKGEDAGPTKNKDQNNQKGVVVGTYSSKGSVSGDSKCPGTTFVTRFEERIQTKLASIGNADGRSPTSTGGMTARDVAHSPITSTFGASGMAGNSLTRSKNSVGEFDQINAGDPDPPVAMTDFAATIVAKQRRGVRGVEQIGIHDATPTPYSEAPDVEDEADQSLATWKPKHVDHDVEDDGLRPFDPEEFEDGVIGKKMTAGAMYVPTIEEEEGAEGFPAPSEPTLSSQRHETAETLLPNDSNRSQIASTTAINRLQIEPNAPTIKRDPSAFIISEAYLVTDINRDDGDEEEQQPAGVLVVARPLPPRWKQIAKHFISFVCCGVVITVATFGAIFLAYDDNYPSLCEIVQRLDYSFRGTSSMQAAVDERSMVLAVGDSELNSIHLWFHSLEGGVWERVDRFEVDGHHLNFSVAISGKTALLGVLNNVNTDVGNEMGGVHIYKQISNMQWVKVEDPTLLQDEGIIGASTFGKSVDVDGDLAVVGSSSAVYILRRLDDDTWAQSDKIELSFVKKVLIAGKTIAVQGSEGDTGQLSIYLYKYDDAQNKMVLLQKPLGKHVSGLAITSGHLVYSECPESTCNVHYQTETCVCDKVYMYHRQNTTQTFSMLQTQDVDKFGLSLALDNDILLITVDDDRATEIYIFGGEQWAKNSTVYYRYNVFSGGNLLSVGLGNYGSTYYSAIEGCM